MYAAIANPCHVPHWSKQLPDVISGIFGCRKIFFNTFRRTGEHWEVFGEEVAEHLLGGKTITPLIFSGSGSVWTMLQKHGHPVPRFPEGTALSTCPENLVNAINSLISAITAKEPK